MQIWIHYKLQSNAMWIFQSLNIVYRFSIIDNLLKVHVE